MYSKVYFIYKLLGPAGNPVEIRRTLRGLCTLKNEKNSNCIGITLKSTYHHYKPTYIIENHKKSLMFSIHYVLSSVPNICENYNLYLMVLIRNEPSQLL